jgi:protein TonB
MFNNLIESSSHAKEFKRRGSFLLFTTATYVVLFVITGVVSIYAYDTHLEEPNLEVVTLLSPQEIVPDVAVPEHPAQQPKNTPSNERSNLPERAVAMLSVNHPEVVPETVSAVPNKNQPLPESGLVRITGIDRDAIGAGSPGPITSGRQIVQPSQVVIADDPPPVPVPKSQIPTTLKISEVLNSKALDLPKPLYPQMAKLARVQGRVAVQVLIDESGKVLSAKAMSGPPLLIVESQRAALQAKFSPTTINGQAVKVSGVITYNFVLP